MIVFPDPNVETEYTDPNGSVWEFNGTGWVRQCESSGSGGGGDDPDWISTCLLINGDNNPDDPRDIIDATGRNRLIVVSERDFGDYTYPFVDTSEFKHGTGSIAFADTNSNSAQTNRGRIEAPSPSWSYPWTIEAWVKRDRNFGAQLGTILSHYSNSTDPYVGKNAFFWTVGWGSSSVANQGLQLQIFHDGVTKAKELRTRALTLGGWHHCAASWDGSDYRIFLDGNLEDTYTSSQTVYTNSAPLSVGMTQNASGQGWQHPFKGWLDDIRVTQGVARYTDSFTPPGKLPSRSTEAQPTLIRLAEESEIFIDDNDAELSNTLIQTNDSEEF